MGAKKEKKGKKGKKKEGKKDKAKEEPKPEGPKKDEAKDPKPEEPKKDEAKSPITEETKSPDESTEKEDKGKKEKKGKKSKTEKEPKTDEAKSPITEGPKSPDGGTEKEEKKEKKEKKPKAKKAPKEKLTKAQKAKRAEQAKKDAEEAAAKAAAEEALRIANERKAAIEKEKRERIEEVIRKDQLQRSCNFINYLMTYNESLREKNNALFEWKLYVDCSKLPNPSKCDQMNTYLHLWETVIENTTIEEASQRTVDVLDLLSSLEDLIEECTQKSRIENWKWVRSRFREMQARSLDVATYKLLRDIDINMNYINIQIADYNYKSDNFTISLWLRVQLPIPMPNPRRPPKPRIEINFEQIKMNVQFPVSIDCESMAIRAVYLKYDHLSDNCHTYQRPDVPEIYPKDLAEAMKIEWKNKLKYKYDNSESPNYGSLELNEDGEFDFPFVPYQKLEPTSSEFVIANEDKLYDDTRLKLIEKIGCNEINLRKFSIIGGIYLLNLLQQPPQPQQFVTMEMTLTTLKIPKELEYAPFCEEYTPPEPPEAGVVRTPEEIEEEMKKQEEELDKLMFVTLTWPNHIIFLELPVVCFWDPIKLCWSNKDVHDLKHQEEKSILTFRTGRFGTFALAGYRYANLPYQGWEIKPEADGSVTLQLTAAILMLEFNVKEDSVCLSQLHNAPNKALQDIVGTYFKLSKLIRIMQNAGVDVFPAFDAFCYVNGSCEKHWPMEKHLYFNIAQLSVCFNFTWSRWNVSAGRRKIIIQMREYHFIKEKPQQQYVLLFVTPLVATYLICTENSPQLEEESPSHLKFSSDLYHLMKSTNGMKVRNKVRDGSKETVYALAELLTATRILSFS